MIVPIRLLVDYAQDPWTDGEILPIITSNVFNSITMIYFLLLKVVLCSWPLIGIKRPPDLFPPAD